MGNERLLPQAVLRVMAADVATQRRSVDRLVGISNAFVAAVQRLGIENLTLKAVAEQSGGAHLRTGIQRYFMSLNDALIFVAKVIAMAPRDFVLTVDHHAILLAAEAALVSRSKESHQASDEAVKRACPRLMAMREAMIRGTGASAC